MKAKFKVGDVVKVKSGSPHMTISGLSTRFKSLQEEGARMKRFDGIYFCTWFQDNRAFHDKFQETVLELVGQEQYGARGEAQKSLTHI
ncbi:DUF2158 domain-containing protein [Chitinophaga agrisoli]|uniref:DUF2158 domain-containing protein n=1 Tax=Chitinophaga agrisoli TaxID=2607653 RepID=A0A5B2W2M5_9BACT|nr:DUF2158 domain-containing protein [Chitinophaga agrisoli]KAA2245000.1 DUF2158 domain-containing protein [Chitinophaga agrisoli]